MIEGKLLIILGIIVYLIIGICWTKHLNKRWSSILPTLGLDIFFTLLWPCSIVGESISLGFNFIIKPVAPFLEKLYAPWGKKDDRN